MADTPKRAWTIDLMMQGSGYVVRTIPNSYKWMGIVNGSNNTIEVYNQATTPAQKATAQRVATVPLYTMMTVPIFQETQYTFIWTDGGGPGPKYAQVIFADENLGLNGLIGSPSAGGTVTIGADSVGLAKASQLPAALGGGGGLKIERVDVGRSTGKATAAGDTVIKSSAGKVWALVCLTSGVTAKLKDASGDRWAVSSATPGNFPVPIACSGNITVNLSGAGEAYVLYE